MDNNNAMTTEQLDAIEELKSQAALAPSAGRDYAIAMAVAECKLLQVPNDTIEGLLPKV